METEKNTILLLDQIPQPGFLVRDDRIQNINQAARAMLLSPGQEFSPLLHTGAEEYAAFQDGQICLTLSIAGKQHNAVITQMEDSRLVLLDPDETLEEFRAMALASMQFRMPLMQAITSAQQLEFPQPAAEKLNQSLMQLLRMVSNMSDISRYSTSVRMEVRDADSFFLELFEKARALTGERITLSFEGLKQPVFTQMDPEQLERALWNILSNCIKFLPETGTIAASLKRQGRLLYLTIEDSGSGIAQEIRATLFQRYLRQPGIEDSRHGLGLGLALVRIAAANHGGTVLLSPSKNGGTRITMTIAIRQDNAATLRSPLFRPDYAGGFDHALVELADCLSADYYTDL